MEFSAPTQPLSQTSVAPAWSWFATARCRMTAGLGIGLSVLSLLALEAKAEGHLITSHGISTFGELKYPADYPHLDYVNPQAPKGGEMSVWAFGSFDSLNPYSIKGRSGGFGSVPLESLLIGTADEIGAEYGLLAASLSYPEDRSEVTFTLHEGITFSDGSPLTAQDVLFSYDLFREKGLPSFRKVLRDSVVSAEVLDPLTIHYVFAEDQPKRDLISLVGGLPVFSKAFYQANDMDLEDNSDMPHLGSGPYVVDMDRTRMGQTMVVKRNPDYWGQDLPINLGRNNFDFLRVEYYSDYNAAFEGFKGGSYHFRNEASSKTWATSYDFPSLEKGWVIKQELQHGNIAPGQSFIFNLRRPQLQDARVREAIGLLFNFEWSNESLFYGVYDRDGSFWANTDLAATGLPSEAELALLTPLADLLPAGVLDAEPVQAPTSGERQLDRKNLRRANGLLNAAGWKINDEGMRMKDGQPLRIEFLNDSQTFDRVINPYVENLRRAGIEAVHSRVDNAEAENRERPPSYDFDIVTGFLQTGYQPGSGLKQYFGSETADTSTFNKAGVKDPAVDALIDAVMAANSQTELAVAVSALDRVLRALQFRVPQWHKSAHTIAYYDMYEHPETLPPYSLGNLDFWWFNADRAEKLQSEGAL
ncbi:MAG: microcin C transport system substrate-binding protein [Paracoccaceae bacterium]|jgi:microcin C transport system substrate-binding protein